MVRQCSPQLPLPGCLLDQLCGVRTVVGKAAQNGDAGNGILTRESHLYAFGLSTDFCTLQLATSETPREPPKFLQPNCRTTSTCLFFKTGLPSNGNITSTSVVVHSSKCSWHGQAIKPKLFSCYDDCRVAQLHHQRARLKGWHVLAQFEQLSPRDFYSTSISSHPL